MPVANPTPGRRQVESWCTTIDGPTGWMEFQAVRGIGKTKTVGEHDSTQGLAQRRSWANSITEREYHWLQDFCLKARWCDLRKASVSQLQPRTDLRRQRSRSQEKLIADGSTHPRWSKCANEYRDLSLPAPHRILYIKVPLLKRETRREKPWS
jgi:hypothetical protein